MKKQKLIHIADIRCNAHWENKIGTYGPVSTILYIGKVPIASYFYDGYRSKNDPKCYKVTISLPTIKEYLGNYETVEECIERCLLVAKIFCNSLG